MSFSSLPPELVRQIIADTVPSTFHSDTYKARQSTLKSICLVSRQFCEIAQPHLRQVVRVLVARYAAESFERVVSGVWAKDVRQMSVWLLDRDEGSATLLKRIAINCPNLTMLEFIVLVKGTELEPITRLSSMSIVYRDLLSLILLACSFRPAKPSPPLYIL